MKHECRTMPTIEREWCEVVKSVITEAQEYITQQLVNPLFNELPGISVQDLASDFATGAARHQRGHEMYPTAESDRADILVFRASAVFQAAPAGEIRRPTFRNDGKRGGTLCGPASNPSPSTTSLAF